MLSIVPAADGRGFLLDEVEKVDKERLYPEIEKVEQTLADVGPDQPNHDAIGAFGSLLYNFEQVPDMPPKGSETLARIRNNFEILFSAKNFESYGGWKAIVHALGCDMARLKMIVSMHADKK
jgi:hypothetical protein